MQLKLRSGMKKLFASFFSLLTFVVALAQETEEKSIEIKINGDVADTGMIWKGILLAIFAFASVVLVYRTFRGKAEV